MTKDGKPVVLHFGDGPMCHTGFGIVARHILNGLYDTGKYDIHSLSINFQGDPHDQTHINCYPVLGDPRGIERFGALLNGLQPDILFTINDYDAVTFIPEMLTRYKQETGKKVTWVAYIPIDGTPVYPEYVEIMRRYIDYPILYTKFGLDEIQKTDKSVTMPYVYHGVDLSLFTKKTVAKRKELRKINKFDNKFVVLATGVNQLRKQFNLVIQAFAEFARDKEDAFLYLHTQPNLRWGWDLLKLVKIFGVWGKVGFTKGASIPFGISFNEMVDVYNVADVYLTMTCGEGFGLQTIEAAACGLPLIYHDCTVNTELIGDAGIAIPTDHHYVFPLGDRSLVRPIPRIDRAVDALNNFYKDKELLKKYGKKALALSKQDHFKWEHAIKVFDDVFTEAMNTEEEELELEEIL